jgi:ELWxxDGT repeat protein
VRCKLHGLCLALGFLIVPFLGGSMAYAQPAYRVADLNTTAPAPNLFSSSVSADQEFEAVGGVVFFVSGDDVHGLELWRTDGTAAGTRLVKDICPGACDSRPSQLTAWNGLLVFTADDGAHGAELWRSDGTEAGTVLVADLNPGTTPSSFNGFLPFGSTLLFIAYDFSSQRWGLWTTDGTTAGTQKVDAFGPSGGPDRFLAAAGGRVLLSASDGTHGVEPWITDGTAAGTYMLSDISPGSEGSFRSYAFTFNIPPRDAAPAPQGGFVFTASDGNYALWYTDGTPGGVVRLQNVAAGELTAFNGALYFAGTDLTSGTGLWKTDGTAAGTVPVKVTDAGFSYPPPQELTVAGNRLFFRATDSTHGDGEELWTSDGTTAGTTVLDLNPGPASTFGGSIVDYPYIFGLSALGNELIFMGYSPGGLQVWRSDGTLAGTVPLTSQGVIDLLRPDTHLVTGGRFFFRTDYMGTEIWTSDGTAAGTHSVVNLSPPPSAFGIFTGALPARSLGALGDLLFFQATDGTSGVEPWKSDGTPGGTSQVAAIETFSYGSYPQQITPLAGQDVFLAITNEWRIWGSDGTAAGTQPLSPTSIDSDGNYLFGSRLAAAGGAVFFTVGKGGQFLGGYQLWKTDGTPAGTAELLDTGGGFSAGISDIRQMTASGGKLFFTVADNQLWTSDGTIPGTVRITAPSDGLDFTAISTLADFGGTLFFVGIGGGFKGLWKTDGTAAGTVLIKDFTGVLVIPRAPSLSSGGHFFFLADDLTTGPELWVSDGTAAGTHLVKDVFPGLRSAEISQLTAAGNKVYFVADDGVHGREPWVSDGTAASTHLVADILPGPGSSVPNNLTAVDGALVFAATDGVHGMELWRTAGTPLGTRMVRDVAPGPLSSSPLQPTVAGPNVYFAANDNATGFELWAVPKANVQAIFGDVPTTFWAWRFVEALAAAGVSSGCGGGDFCPGAFINRAQMAVFVLTARGTAPPPATGTRFDDVPAGYWAGPWIEELAREGVVGGCSANPPLYCPDNLLTRAEMAVLLTLARGENPPPATGTRFADVPAGYWAARFIEQLAADGITSGCGGGNYCPDLAVTRGEMAVFLATAFHLPLP